MIGENEKRREIIVGSKKKAIILGAGSASKILLGILTETNKMPYKPVCILDDDENKRNSVIYGVKVEGKIADVDFFCKKYDADAIIYAMPSVGGARKVEIINECRMTGRKVLVIPNYYTFVDSSSQPMVLAKVDILDLLGREQIKVNVKGIKEFVKDKVVLVTGGGGSIGSELCRQVARYNPKQLIIFDIYENNAYDIQQELKRHYPSLNLLTLIGSVRDSKKVNDVFKKYRPKVVFHAAAHKHVPLMEDSPNEAIKNNVSGTYKVAKAAGENGVKKFILISTDKAVNPTNIMGATKRICEMIIQAMDKRYKTEYAAVRFGNVLGSNGSVIPLFKKQIEEGGPVTVTHKDIVRYFMTISEAVSLVLEAAVYAKGGEIFVLDMGKPVKIYDLAVNLIRLSGHVPDEDIKIEFCGLRPGEKLYEECLMSEEGLEKTENDLISVGKPLDFDEENLFRKIEELYIEAYNETDRMKELVKELVPTYVIDKK